MKKIIPVVLLSLSIFVLHLHASEFEVKTLKNAESLTIPLPQGAYLVYASRGPDYSLDYKVTEILKGTTQELVFQIDRGELGYCRTYVHYEGGKGDNLDWPLLEKALKKGRSFVSNGPLVEFKINDIHRPGDLVTESKGQVRVFVEVRSAPWISVDEVRLVVNGERKIFFPVKCQNERILKFSGEIGLSLEKDAYIAIEVLGKKSLFPVLQSQARNGRLERTTLPYALTNPIFVDADGTGRFDPPWPDKIRLSSSPILLKTGEERY